MCEHSPTAPDESSDNMPYVWIQEAQTQYRLAHRAPSGTHHVTMARAAIEIANILMIAKGKA